MLDSSHQLNTQIKIPSTSAPTACSVLHLRLEAPQLHGQDPAIKPGWARKGSRLISGWGLVTAWEERFTAKLDSAVAADQSRAQSQCPHS